jgi:hypothetical protein
VSPKTPPERAAPSPERAAPPHISAAPVPADQGNGVRFPFWFLFTLIGATGIALVLAVVSRQAPATLIGDAKTLARQARESSGSRDRGSPLARVAVYGRRSIDREQKADVRLADLDMAGRIQAAKLIRELILEAEARARASPKLRLVEPMRASETSGATDVCSIRVWQGYLRSRFVAMQLVPSVQAETIAESPPFRAGGADVPEWTVASAHALTEPLRRLDELGWTTVNEGPHWFDRQLARRQPADEGDAA